jgi:cobalamin biosynthesis Mg chelatase CobN
MTTARDIITRSLRELGVVAGTENPAAEDADAALDVLNDMLAAWEMDAIPLGLGVLSLNTDIAAPASHMECMRANLTARIAPVFGLAAPSIVVEQAARGYRNLQASYARRRLLTADPGLRYRRETLGGW